MWASNFTASSDLRVQLGQTLRALALELAQGFNYVGSGVVVWALLFCGRQLTRKPEFWLLAIYVLMHSTILILLGVKASYVSERHALPIVMLCCFPCVLGLAHLASFCIRWLKTDPRPASGCLHSTAIQRLSIAMLVPLLAICLTKTIQPLHGNRVGNHRAGRWLAQRVRVGDVVEDEHKWSHFYSGLFFNESIDPVLPADFEPKCYTVVTRSLDHGVREVRELKEHDIKLAKGQLVYQWPVEAPPEKARIVVYEAPRDPVTHPWHRDRPPLEAHPVSRPRN